MGRKKKIVKEEKKFIPSTYQEAIFDFVKNGSGNAVIEAVAGSGKSTTALKCLELLTNGEKVLLTSFNKEIVTELTGRIKGLPNKENIDCRTLHSLGNMILRQNYPHKIDPQPNTFKYSGYIYNNIKSLSYGYYSTLEQKDREKYIDNVRRLVDYGRYFLCETVDDLEFVEKHYHITTYENEKEVALDIMEWGKNNIDTIDFTDMIWLPNVLECSTEGCDYDWIICDECQDTMTAERLLLLMCRKESTRMLFFGEKVQCIYSFMGSDYRSFDELRKLPNTISLPLSISYRCSKSVVNMAKRFNQSIEAREDAPNGEIKYDVSIDEIQDGDMVLCRLNAPLLQLYCEITKLGKPAYIRGKDIGSNLITSIKKTKQEKLNKDLEAVGVFSSLYSDLLRDIDVTMKKHKITLDMAMDDMDISSTYDKIQALEAISNDVSTAEELIDKIKKLFSDKEKKGIQLSTIHKAKGLEADNVFICCPSMLPLRSAKEEWELEEEANLEYVAYTRAKNNLSFLDEKEFTVYSSNGQQKASEIEGVKRKLEKLTGKKRKTAKEIISNPTKINGIKGKSIDLGNITSKRSISAFQPQKIRRKKLL